MSMADECVEYEGYRDRAGYGKRKIGGKPRLAHRVAYCEANDLSLEDIGGKVVRHTCDNPSCINPDHLVLGTQADNMRDKVERGRTSSTAGERSVQAKLTTEQVLAIREEYVPRCRTHGGRALARKYGVSQTLIRHIISRRQWTHVDG